MRHLQHLIRREVNPWSSGTEEPLHSSTMEKSERRTQDQDQRWQSGPSARNSYNSSEGRFSKDYRADQQRLQISDLHFDKFPTPATFACWKIRFRTEVCTCSQSPTDAMLWIKEVEMVDSLEELNSSRSVCGKNFPSSEAGREDCFCSEQDHPEFRGSRRSVSRNRKPRKRTDGRGGASRSSWASSPSRTLSCAF